VFVQTVEYRSLPSSPGGYGIEFEHALDGRHRYSKYW
jgi:hypothetical protein